MELCDDGHDQICYDGGKCPFCESISDLEATVEKTRKDAHNEGYEEGYDKGLHDA